MTGAVLLLGAVLLVAALGASSSAGGDGPRSPVEVLERGRAVWVIGPASTLGAVLGGSPSEALAARGAVAIACGPMFSGGLPENLLRDEGAGVDVPSRFPSRGATVAVVDGLAYVATGAEVLGAAAVAVQGSPELVRRGRLEPVADSPRVRRVALAVMPGGQRVALVSFVGTMADFGRELLEGGAVEAVYLDGGRAAHLQVGAAALVAFDPSERPASWVTLGAA